jgi:hypothetical protein
MTRRVGYDGYGLFIFINATPSTTSPHDQKDICRDHMATYCVVVRLDAIGSMSFYRNAYVCVKNGGDVIIGQLLAPSAELSFGGFTADPLTQVPKGSGGLLKLSVPQAVMS